MEIKMTDYKKLFEQTKSMSMLLVEDYEPLRNEIAELLEDYFSVVVSASNGQEAIEKYEAYQKKYNEHIDIILADIHMPVMNGVDMTERIMAISREQKIIILSAYTKSDDLLRLINAGISRFIQKPVKDEELFDALFVISGEIKESIVPISRDEMLWIDEHHRWDKNSSTMRCDNKPISMTHHEKILLKQLVDNRGSTCSNEDIVQNFYLTNIDISEKSIRNLIYKLRKKLPETLISSQYGAGYRLRIVKTSSPNPQN